MNHNKINRQERQAIARRLGWTCYQVRCAIKAHGGPGPFRAALDSGTVTQPAERQKPKRGGEHPFVTTFERWRDIHFNS